MAAAFVPAVEDWEVVREAALSCRGCDLWERATQTVFGQGDLAARLMLVGEQPGDKEDLAGQPFVGPAGRLLDDALAEAGIDRSDVYITNAVKPSSGASRASGGCTRSRTRSRSAPAGPGWTRRSRSCGRAASC